MRLLPVADRSQSASIVGRIFQFSSNFYTQRSHYLTCVFVIENGLSNLSYNNQ